MITKIKAFINDQDGSESIEMVYSTAVLISFILVALMVMTYIFALNNVRLATRRICRDIEVTGIVASQIELDNTFRSALSSSQYSGHDIDVTNLSGFNIAGYQVDFLDTFIVRGHCDFEIPLLNPGTFTGYTISLPITIQLSGLSEVKHSN